MRKFIEWFKGLCFPEWINIKIFDTGSDYVPKNIPIHETTYFKNLFEKNGWSYADKWDEERIKKFMKIWDDVKKELQKLEENNKNKKGD